MKKGCLSEEISEVALTKNLIISGDPSLEKQEEFLRTTKTPYFAEPFR